MLVINSLDKVLSLLVKNKESLKPIPFIKIDSLKIYYDIRLEGMYTLKLTSNSPYLKENQFVLDYFHDYQDLIDYVETHYSENIQLVEKQLVNEIAKTKQYLHENCSSFKEVLKPLKNKQALYYELALEAYVLNLIYPNLKYDVKIRKLDLYDDTNLISSRYNIYRER